MCRICAASCPRAYGRKTGEELPHIGDRPSWGYINVWERDGDEFVPRRGDNAQPLSSEPSRWDSETTPEDWRRILLDALGTEALEYVDEEVEHLMQEVEKEATAAFSDGVNTGFYINSYTIKVNPSMDGMLDELRSGLERLQQRREEEPERFRSHFAQTLDVLKNLSSSYRRCYHKSGSEMLFPMLFGHMTFASHRCWTVFIGKPVFLMHEGWRQQYGKAVRHSA